MITNNDAGPTVATLRARGLRLTRQRRIILEVVRSTDAHPTAALVYRRVRRRLPRLSLATVYRNLRTLAAEGFLTERADPSGVRFDGNTAPHDHFTCVSCGRIYDVPPLAGSGARRALSTRTGFEVLDHRIEFYGRCTRCRRRSGRTSARRTEEELWQARASTRPRASKT
jgi:Fur family transcriptional regulator, peroxide stress response regulator